MCCYSPPNNEVCITVPKKKRSPIEFRVMWSKARSYAQPSVSSTFFVDNLCEYHNKDQRPQVFIYVHRTQSTHPLAYTHNALSPCLTSKSRALCMNAESAHQSMYVKPHIVPMREKYIARQRMHCVDTDVPYSNAA